MVRRAGGATVSLAAMSLLATGCALFPSDPAGPLSGARVEHGVIHVKVPTCPGDQQDRLEVVDFDDADSPTPRIVWWASGPVDAAAHRGEVELFTGKGFRHSAPAPAASDIPRNIEVDYIGPDGAWGEVFNMKEITTARLKSGQYWTSKGPKTTAQIDAQLPCHGSGKEPARSPGPSLGRTKPPKVDQQ